MIDETVPAAEGPLYRGVRIDGRDGAVAAEEKIEERLDLLLGELGHGWHRALAVLELGADFLLREAQSHAPQRRRVADALAVRPMAREADGLIHLLALGRWLEWLGVDVAKTGYEPRDFIGRDVKAPGARVKGCAGPFRAAVDIEEQRRLRFLNARIRAGVGALHHGEHDRLGLRSGGQIGQGVGLAGEGLGQLGHRLHGRGLIAGQRAGVHADEAVIVKRLAGDAIEQQRVAELGDLGHGVRPSRRRARR